MSNRNFYIAGIGASAGGLEAMKEFFSHIPAKTGIAYVVVQHLHPEFKNFTAELLRPYTPLPIVPITDKLPVQANHIYMLPPDKLVKLSDHHFIVEERSVTQAVNIAIDVFFNSLGIAVGDSSIAIILSGMGSDGSLGIKTITEEGGLVMVQSPESARFEDMPASAISIDSPAFVATPAQIAEKLLKYII